MEVPAYLRTPGYAPGFAGDTKIRVVGRYFYFFISITELIKNGPESIFLPSMSDNCSFLSK